MGSQDTYYGMNNVHKFVFTGQEENLDVNKASILVRGLHVY